MHIKTNYFTKLIIMVMVVFLYGCEHEYNADIIINNAHILTVDPDMRCFEKGSLVIRDGKIAAVGNSEDIEGLYRAPENIDGTNKLVMPGLINTHTHAAMSIFRGFADDIPLHVWLNKYIFPIEQEFVTAENVAIGTELAVAEMLRSGTTTFNDMYYYVDQVAEVVDKTGIRAVLSKALIDFPVPGTPTPEQGMKEAHRLIEKWGAYPRINFAVAAHAPYTCSPKLIKDAKRIADKYQVAFHMHVAETKMEFETFKKEYGHTPVSFLNDLGVLDENMIAAHCVHITSEDIELIVNKGVGVAHNPQCNMKIGSGVAPIPRLIEAGAKVGLGTDGLASNNDLDMFDEMRTAAFIHKLINNDPTVMDAKTVVKMATIGGAKVLGLEEQIGSLEAGKKADVIIIDLEKAHARPLYNIYSHIVYSMKGSDVETVIVDGKIVMKNRDFINIQEDVLYGKVDSLAAEIGDRFREIAVTNTKNNNVE